MKHCLSVLVENKEGILARVASLFGQRGFNIDSLTVSTTENPDISRITIMTNGDKKTLIQIMKQTEKLIITKLVLNIDIDDSILRELMLLKLKANEQELKEIKEIAGRYDARLIDRTGSAVVIELTAEPDIIDSFYKEIEGSFKIIEMCRTGATAMEKGNISYQF